MEQIAYVPPRWSAVFGLTLCVSTLIASEFMPVSLLTPLAVDLHLSEGLAGQAIAVSGLFAVLTSLGIARISAGMDRRTLLLALTLAMLVSGLMVSLAPNASIFMAGRALLGIVIGGFWSMSAATVMRLVPPPDVPRALALLNGGNALATTVAAPLGSFLGQFVGWRMAFFMVVPLAALTFVWKVLTLPAMPTEAARRRESPLGLLDRAEVRQGMLAVALLFAGQFCVFTYLRPFMEQQARIPVSGISLILLLMGGAGVAGNALMGRLVSGSLQQALVLPPACLALLAGVLAALPTGSLSVATLLLLWGLIATPAPVGWWTWLARTLPDDAEAGGGLMVAVIQLAITLGATAGGLLFDSIGVVATFLAGCAFLAVSALLSLANGRRAPSHQSRSQT